MKRLVLFMMAVMLLSITVNAQKKGGKTLVAYFSATGTTARAAKLVAETVDGTLYEIQPAKKYTARQSFAQQCGDVGFQIASCIVF